MKFPKTLNYYINNFPLSNLSNLVANSQYFITHTNDMENYILGALGQLFTGA